MQNWALIFGIFSYLYMIDTSKVEYTWICFNIWPGHKIVYFVNCILNWIFARGVLKAYRSLQP